MSVFGPVMPEVDFDVATWFTWGTGLPCASRCTSLGPSESAAVGVFSVAISFIWLLATTVLLVRYRRETKKSGGRRSGGLGPRARCAGRHRWAIVPEGHRAAGR